MLPSLFFITVWSLQDQFGHRFEPPSPAFSPKSSRPTFQTDINHRGFRAATAHNISSAARVKSKIDSLSVVSRPSTASSPRKLQRKGRAGSRTARYSRPPTRGSGSGNRRGTHEDMQQLNAKEVLRFGHMGNWGSGKDSPTA